MRGGSAEMQDCGDAGAVHDAAAGDHRVVGLPREKPVRATVPEITMHVVILNEAAIDLRQVCRRGRAKSRELRPQSLDLRALNPRVELRRLMAKDIELGPPRIKGRTRCPVLALIPSAARFANADPEKAISNQYCAYR